MKAAIRSDGLRHAVEIDGQDVSNAVSCATVYLEGHQSAQATLEVSLPIIETVTHARVEVSDAARELLVKAGWTPPRS